MKKFLLFLCSLFVCIGFAEAAVRDENATDRQSSSNINSNTQNRSATVQKSVVTNRASTTSRGSQQKSPTTTRSGVNQTVISRSAVSTNTPTNSSAISNTLTSRPSTTINRTSTTNTNNISRAATNVAVRNQTPVVSRAAIDETSSVITETRTGAEYEKCKTAYFTCMDQFCQLKDDNYRRCSCSNRVFELSEIRGVMQDAGQQLTVFTENLDVVGMTAEQATAMKTASEGEKALTDDNSASKALLQAIMNSIRGEDATVGGKFSDLNSINLAFDSANAFGTQDAGQIIATYNGQNLYNAVYPQCRAAVKADCTDAQLQRAITAYLMAVEQDCNTVASSIEKQQKEMKSSVRESSALLDLARVENRQKHNSDDITTCLNNVESAILSEEVCGANYKKCLDNGEFIDVSTGSPIAGVENFYELGNLLKFADGVDAADQKLSKVSANKPFVTNFEKRVKKFAEPALDKCVEDADEVWSEYLDRALLAIYYSQQDKVDEIKQGCFDLVSACYMNGDKSLTDAMKEITDGYDVVLQPDKITLNTTMCNDYITSCNMMFAEESGDIIADYINNRQETDTLTACRAVAKQCFDKYGGTGYENFYYPYSGLFTAGDALKWFTLYERDRTGQIVKNSNGEPTIVSECAKQLKSIESCSSEDMLEKAFGGFDLINAHKALLNNESQYFITNDKFIIDHDNLVLKKLYAQPSPNYTSHTTIQAFSINNGNIGRLDFSSASGISVNWIQHRTPRATGVATEIYNQIVDTLTTQCTNVQGRFVEYQFIKDGLYNEDNFCLATFEGSHEYGGASGFPNLFSLYSILENENMCPRDYSLSVDTQSWGACLCWENGGRRSKNGLSPKCVAALPVAETANDNNCSDTTPWDTSSGVPTINNWCTKGTTYKNQVCPLNADASTEEESKGYCKTDTNLILDNLPEGL